MGVPVCGWIARATCSEQVLVTVPTLAKVINGNPLGRAELEVPSYTHHLDGSVSVGSAMTGFSSFRLMGPWNNGMLADEIFGLPVLGKPKTIPKH